MRMEQVSDPLTKDEVLESELATAAPQVQR